MRRRQFITLLGAAAAWPLAARAQSNNVPVIGILNPTPRSGMWVPLEAAFRKGLSDTGYTEGRNLRIEGRWADGQYDRLPGLAADLVQRGVAAIAAFTTPAVQAAKAATTTIPIVFTTIADPVQIGFAASLNRPGGNLTGLSVLAVEAGPKEMELLHAAAPSANSMALLINPGNPNADAQSKNLQMAAQRLGLQLHVLQASAEADLDPAFARMHELKANALMIAADVFFNTQTEKLADLSLRYAIPSIYQIRDFAEAGGLISYGTDLRDEYRQAGIYVGRILKGEKPGELPVIQAAKFELILNLKTAKALGLNVSADVVSIADEVIE
jgi:putative tryptophan/tyrosine transport system substrate-binding protein